MVLPAAVQADVILRLDAESDEDKEINKKSILLLLRRILLLDGDGGDLSATSWGYCGRDILAFKSF